MQLKNVLLAASLALSASAAGNSTNSTDIAPSIQSRLVSLELGYIHTELMLSQLAAETEDVTADDVVKTYLQTIRAEDQALDKPQPQPSRPLSDSMQLTICQAFHSLTTSGLRLDNAFVNNVNQFNETQRDDIRSGVEQVSDETERFVSGVAKNALTYCLATIQADNGALKESFEMVKGAYEQ